MERYKISSNVIVNFKSNEIGGITLDLLSTKELDEMVEGASLIE